MYLAKFWMKWRRFASQRFASAKELFDLNWKEPYNIPIYAYSICKMGSAKE